MVRKLKSFILFAAVLAALLPTACTDDESGIGLSLIDPTTQYTGLHDTLYADYAYSQRDDSLLTSNYSFGIVGNHADATFGRVTSTLYTQIALASLDNSINLSEATFDSVVLCLWIDGLYPDTTADYNFHFEVMQLAEPVLGDTTYFSFQTMPVDGSRKFFDGNVTVHAHDSIVRLKLGGDIISVINQSADSKEEFIEKTKGLRIRIVDDADMGMLGIDFSNSRTRLSAYYNMYGNDSNEYKFEIGAGAAHFTHFEHDYTGTTFGADSINGMQRMYLEPLGGYNARINFNTQLQAFHLAHPTATVHYAELRLPTAPESDNMKPDNILVLTKNANGNESYIDDWIDPYTYHGYDGSYDSEKSYYRIRVTQHLQGLLRQGEDKGFMLVLNSRRSAAHRTILYGPEGAKKPMIVFVYSE